MRRTQAIDFFSSPKSRFMGFSEIRQPHHDTVNNEQQYQEQIKSFRKSSFNFNCEPIIPLGDDFFAQGLQECQQQQCSQLNLNDRMRVKSPPGLIKDDQRLVMTCTSKNTNQKLDFKFGSGDKPQQNIQEEFRTPKKKAQFFSYRKFHQSTSEKERPVPRNNEKGLKRLSSLAYSIVNQSSTTTYKEVAEKLLGHLNFDCNQMDEEQSRTQKSSMQNVKRRVYDSLNVLLALGVIKRIGNKIARQKHKKTCLSGQFPDIEKYNQMIDEYERRLLNLQTKRRTQRQLRQKLEIFRKILERNKKTKLIAKNKIIRLPFLVFASHQQHQSVSNKNYEKQNSYKKIEWHSKGLTGNQGKQKKRAHKRNKKSTQQIQNRNQQIVQINFEGYPQSYGDLDFFKLFQQQKTEQGGNFNQFDEYESKNEQNQDEGFKYPFEQLQSQKDMIQENNMSMNYINSVFQNQ